MRAAWPEVRIVLRGDSGFCREAIMSWCETHRVEYVLGLAKNSRLTEIIAGEMAKARGAYEASGEAARWFKDFRYQTRESWTCERRVVGKAEYLAKGENPRFIVTSLRRTGRREPCTKICIVPVGRWKTGSRNSNSSSSPIARAPTQ